MEKHKQYKIRGRNSQNQVITTPQNSYVIDESDSRYKKEPFVKGVWRVLMTSVVFISILMILAIIKSCNFGQNNHAINNKGASVIISPSSFYRTSDTKEKQHEYPLEFQVNILDKDEKVNYIKDVTSRDLRTISKTKYHEICVVVNSRQFKSDTFVAFNVRLLDVKDKVLKVFLSTFSPGYKRSWALWECEEGFIDLPVGLYKFEVNLAGNVQYKPYRIVK